MIDALMYGMMPSAKIESCSSAPPENRLNRPNDRCPASAAKKLLQRLGVDARASAMCDADAVDREHRRT